MTQHDSERHHQRGIHHGWTDMELFGHPAQTAARNVYSSKPDVVEVFMRGYAVGVADFRAGRPNSSGW